MEPRENREVPVGIGWPVAPPVDDVGANVVEFDELPVCCIPPWCRVFDQAGIRDRKALRNSRSFRISQERF